jgi:branched-chain amino acid transport system permease protein
VTLEVKGLSKHFGGVTAVNDASFALREGKITALIGPNGAGKTTVFNLITGFIKPDAGSVYLYGLDITKLPPFSRARLGIVRTFQEVRFFKNLSVLDNVMLGCPKQDGEKLRFLFFLPRRVARQDRESIRRAMTSLNFVGLGDKARELAANLSFAEHKMLVLACALATGADILLLDEVASGTDPTAIDKELALIRRLAAFGKTICIVEHNLEIVSKLADFSYFLAQGRVIASGTPSELMSNDELVEMYFGRKAIAT